MKDFFQKLVQGLFISNLFLFLCSGLNVAIYQFSVVWMIIFVSTVATIFQPPYNPLKKNENADDGGTLLLLIWSVYIPQSLALIYAFHVNADHYPDIDAVTLVSMAVCLLGLGLRVWSYQVLGRFFTADVKFQEGQKVIASGPYRYLRHPSYTGAILIYSMFPVMLKAWPIAPFAFLFLLLSLLKRIRLEEALMNEKLGANYALFSNERKRLIPLIW